MEGRQVKLKIIDIELGLADIEEIPDKYVPIGNVIFFTFMKEIG